MIMWFAPIVLHWSVHNALVVELATKYLHALVWCIFPLSFLIVMEQFLIGLSRTRLVLWISLLQVPCEIIFGYALIFGKFGMPKCGIAGLGYAFTVVFILAAIVISVFLCKSKVTHVYQVFSNFGRVDTEYLWELFRIGWPIGCMYTIEIALFLVVVLLMGQLGSDVLAAHQIAWQYLGLTITLVFAISQATTVRVGQAVGRNDKPSIELAVYVNMAIGFVLMLLVAILYIGFPKIIISIDIDVYATKHAALVSYAVKFLTIAGIFQLFDSVRLISVGALRGLKDTKVPMYISVFAFWVVALPSAYAMGFILHKGGVGMWYGLIVGIATGALILAIRFRWFIRKVNLAELIIPDICFED